MAYNRLHVVVETPSFVADAKAAGLSAEERHRVVDRYASTPEAGVLMPGTGGARKLRFAGRGHGKRGGYRVISYHAGPDMPVFLLAVFAKGDRVNLTPAECNALRSLLAVLGAAYREGVKRHVQSR